LHVKASFLRGLVKIAMLTYLFYVLTLMINLHYEHHTNIAMKGALTLTSNPQTSQDPPTRSQPFLSLTKIEETPVELRELKTKTKTKLEELTLQKAP
jgi:hypothetical protein